MRVKELLMLGWWLALRLPSNSPVPGASSCLRSKRLVGKEKHEFSFRSWEVKMSFSQFLVSSWSAVENSATFRMSLVVATNMIWIPIFFTQSVMRHWNWWDPEKSWMPHPQRCSSPGWMRPWSTWSSGWHTCLWKGGWTGWSFCSLYSPSHFMILWVYDSKVIFCISCC